MSALGSMTKTKVIVERRLWSEIVGRLQRTERLALSLREQLEDEHHLLVIALSQLAVERGKGDREYFIRKWLREQRGLPEPRGRARTNGHR